MGDETYQMLSSASKPKNPSSQRVTIVDHQQLQPQQSAPATNQSEQAKVDYIRKKILSDCRRIHSFEEALPIIRKHLGYLDVSITDKLYRSEAEMKEYEAIDEP